MTMDISGLYCLYAWSFLVELEKHIIIARCHLISKGRQFIVDTKHFENRIRCYKLLVPYSTCPLPQNPEIYGIIDDLSYFGPQLLR